MYKVNKIDAFSDNYIWAITTKEKCSIVDPGNAEPVIDYLLEQNLELTDILLTHHHPDHVGGVKELIQRFPNAQVFAPNNQRFPMVTVLCKDQQKIKLNNNNIELTVISLVGHTLDHIGFHDERNAFVGDTLFSGGCGRLFEGSPVEMHNSLQKLAELPSHTNIYCAHEYTLANLEFACTVEPDNMNLFEYQQLVIRMRNNDISSIPTTIKTELKINPFLRCSSKTIQNNVRENFDICENISEQHTFTMLREWKNNF